jgi:hypothetical protein
MAAAVGEKGDLIAVRSGSRRQYLAGLTGNRRRLADVVGCITTEWKPPEVEPHSHPRRCNQPRIVDVRLFVPHIRRRNRAGHAIQPRLPQAQRG